jgi:hypothetical protein
VVIWEMTTGKRLFGANPAQTDIDIAREIVDHEARRPSTVKPGYPEQLEHVVMKGLARDPALRYQTAEALQIDLEAMIRTRGMWVSSRDVIAFMRDLFADRLTAWQSAQRDGRSAAEMLAAVYSAPSTSTVSPIQLAPGPNPSLPPQQQPQPSSPQPSPPRSIALWVVGVVLVIAASVFGGWLAGRGARTTTPSTAAPSKPPTGPTATTDPPIRPLPRTPPPATAGGEAPADLDTEDEHFFQADDYLITDEAYTSGRLEKLEVAKMTAPAKGPNQPATFLTSESVVRTTNHYWRTRVATPDDLVFGAIAFCPTVNHWDNHSRKLDNKLESRMSPWSIARITDVADVDNGKVQLGELTCRTNVVRVQL